MVGQPFLNLSSPAGLHVFSDSYRLGMGNLGQNLARGGLGNVMAKRERAFYAEGYLPKSKAFLLLE